MRFVPFVAWSALGTLLWTGLLTSAGYVLEAHYESVGTWIDMATLAMAEWLIDARPPGRAAGCVATAAATSGSGLHAVQVVGRAAVFSAGMIVLAGRCLPRLRRGRTRHALARIIFVGVLLSAYVYR